MFSALGPFIEFEEIDLPEFWGDMDDQKHMYEDFDKVLLEMNTLLPEIHASKTQSKSLENPEDLRKHRKSTLSPSPSEEQKETTARQEPNEISIKEQEQDTESAGEQDVRRESVTEQGTYIGLTPEQGSMRELITEQIPHRESITEQGSPPRMSTSEQGIHIESIAEQGLDSESITAQGEHEESTVGQETHRGSTAEQGSRRESVVQGPQRGSIAEGPRRKSVIRKGSHKGSTAEQGSHRVSITEEPLKGSTEEREPSRERTPEEQDVDSASQSREGNSLRESETSREHIEIPPREEQTQEQAYEEALVTISELQEEDPVSRTKDHLSETAKKEVQKDKFCEPKSPEIEGKSWSGDSFNPPCINTLEQKHCKS